MAAYSYADFRIRIEPGPGPPGTSFRVEASSPIAGDRSTTVELPFNADQIENFILKMARPRRGVRQIDSPEMQLAKTFGGSLFSMLMSGPIGNAFREAKGAARAQGQGLRLTLSLTDVPDLAAIPWEFLYDEPDFLTTSRRTPVVRSLDVMSPMRAFDLRLPIRILAVVSLPAEADELQTGQERANLERALAPLIATGAVHIEWVEHATLGAMNDAIRDGDFHILHFIGHGGFDKQHEEGALLFEDAQHRGEIVGADRLASILRDRDSLQLVVLNSCEGARTDGRDPFSGVASSLIQREVPAVIGMQFEITDRAAIIFSTSFYRVLCEGEPVDAALAEARRAIYADKNDVEW